MQLDGIEGLGFFVTVAIVASALFHLQMSLDEGLVDSIQRLLAEELTALMPRGWDAVSDLVKFIDGGRKPQMPSGALSSWKLASVLHEIHERMGGAVGSWVLWNLKGSAPSDGELPLVSAIGRFCYEVLGEELCADFVKHS